MAKPKVEELQKLNWTASTLNETLDELNGDLAETAKFLVSIREACDAKPHSADLEGLADVVSRICGDLEAAKDTEARAEIQPLLARLGFRMGLNFRDGIKGKKFRFGS